MGPTSKSSSFCRPGAPFRSDRVGSVEKWVAAQTEADKGKQSFPSWKNTSFQVVARKELTVGPHRFTQLTSIVLEASPATALSFCNLLLESLSRMLSARYGRWLYLLWSLLILLKSEGVNVDITYVESALAKGAVCLDGSPPAYHLSPGFGSGVDNWLVQIEGGGWCNNVTTCLARKTTRLGSSKEMVRQLAFSGILSNNQQSNPDFYNWNKVKVRYCDGSSFTGDFEAVDPATNLHFRGARVWLAIVEDLLAKGMKNAKNAILSGCSAGGLTSILHCDNFRSLLPSAKVKCVADAGYFINAKDVSGASHIESFYNDVVETHNSAKNLPAACTSKLRAGLCFFPQNVAPYIQTPLFLVNAAYDSWQIKNILAPGVADPHGLWHNCKLDIKSCSASQLATMQSYRLEFLDALNGVKTSPSNGMFVDACYAHCQTEMQETWLRDDSPTLKNTKIAEAVGDWFFDRTTFRTIDCAYPCNPTCHNRIFEPRTDLSEPDSILQES